MVKILLNAGGDLNVEIISFIDLAFSNNLTDFIYTLIKGEAKLNIFNRPDERILSTYSLSSVFKSTFDFNDSSILTASERIELKELLNILTEGNLIYRASRDGFSASSFHLKCDGISNTVTIIKTTSNSVFGGFTSAMWTSNVKHQTRNQKHDANAVIYSLRKEGRQNKQRINVTEPHFAIYNDLLYGPTFGGGHDIYVSDYSNQNYNSYSNLGFSYRLLNNITFASEAKGYLAGSYYWQTTEIEVYQVSPFEPFSVSFIHNG